MKHITFKIKEKSNSYINEEFAWNDVFYDLFSLACFYTNRYDKAILYLNNAIKINPSNKRYKENLKIMTELISHE